MIILAYIVKLRKYRIENIVWLRLGNPDYWNDRWQVVTQFVGKYPSFTPHLFPRRQKICQMFSGMAALRELLTGGALGAHTLLPA